MKKPRIMRLALALLVGITSTCVAANLHPSPLPPGTRADHIVVRKSEHTLTLYTGERAIRRYTVSLGEPRGDKRQEGDRRTPEGLYRIDFHKRESAFHRAMHISYPSPEDEARAAAAGVSPGGDIMVHGLRNGLGAIGSMHRLVDWTAGCVALTNWEIEELWRVVPDGTPIEIRP